MYQYNITATPATHTSSTSPATSTPVLIISCPDSNGTTYTAARGEEFLLECFIDHYGGDLIMQYTDSYGSCMNVCAALSWVPPSPAPCYLKLRIGAGIQSSDVWGARVVASSTISTTVTSITGSSAGSTSTEITSSIPADTDSPYINTTSTIASPLASSYTDVSTSSTETATLSSYSSTYHLSPTIAMTTDTTSSISTPSTPSSSQTI